MFVDVACVHQKDWQMSLGDKGLGETRGVYILSKVICINQKDSRMKGKGILSLGACLKNSDHLLILWDSVWACWFLVSLLRAFYEGQQRWVAVRGHFASSCVAPTRGLLQGCPASVGLLNGLMLLWVRSIRATSPTVSMSVFLDDRALWSTGRGAPDHLCTALQTAATVDQALALQVHPDKLACWATRAPARRVLAARPALCGPVVSGFKLLGIHYRLCAHTGAVDSARLNPVITNRARRIAIAARHLHQRRRLLMALVISLVSWLGPWTSVPHLTAQGWARAVETAVDRVVSARSRFLLWAVWARPRLHPKFALAFAAVRHELRRSGGAQPPPARSRACPALAAALSTFAWTIRPDGVWCTPFGQFRPGFLSVGVARLLAEDSWLRELWAVDPKSGGPLQATSHFALRYHRAQAPHHATGGAMRRVLHAAAHDTRTLERMRIPFTPCVCGDPLPTRTHVTFDCPAMPSPLAHRSSAEHRFLVPLLSGLSAPEWQLPDVPEDLLLALSDAETIDSALLVATDGSACGSSTQAGALLVHLV